MANASYTVEILDKNLLPITRVNAFVPINDRGDILQYSNRLSDSGKARLRIATLDPVLTRYGNILKPWANHIRITREGRLEWQGYIQDMPERNSRYIEINAFTYIEQAKKVQIGHDPITPDGEDIKNYKTGTMSDAIRAIITEIRNNATGLTIANMTPGQIDNPLFPDGFTNASNASIAGQPWTFSDLFSLKFDFVDMHYILTAFGMYSGYDYELTPAMVYNFVKRLGQDRPELVFEYGQWGMIEEFNAPLDGKNQANHIIAIGADYDNKLLKLDVPRDQPSIDLYGKLDGTAAYNDVKNSSTLRQRLSEELRLNSTPDTELSVTLNDRAYPRGQYNLGDACTFKIKYGAIDYSGLRQIVGETVYVHNTFRERIMLTTNKPRIVK